MDDIFGGTEGKILNISPGLPFCHSIKHHSRGFCRSHKSPKVVETLSKEFSLAGGRRGSMRGTCHAVAGLHLGPYEEECECPPEESSPWLTTNKGMGTSGWQPQAPGSWQQPEWVFKQIIPQSLQIKASPDDNDFYLMKSWDPWDHCKIRTEFSRTDGRHE